MILIVEDDAFKHERIRTVLSALNFTSLKWAKSVHSGVNALIDDKYEGIILDMALPSHDAVERGASPTSLPSGGLELIYELSYMNVQTPLIIITQYPEIEVEGDYVKLNDAGSRLERLYGISILRVIGFDQNSSDWEIELANAMGSLI